MANDQLTAPTADSRCAEIGPDPTVLLVEDDDVFRTRLLSALAARGFEAAGASGVGEALDLVEQSAPAYAVVDLRLLDGNGLDVIDALKRRRPEARPIMLTGYGDVPTAVAATKLGAIDYVAKPASAEEIVDALLAPEGEHAAPPVEATTPDEAREQHVLDVLEKSDRNISEAARKLNMHRRTLQRILARLGGR